MTTFLVHDDPDFLHAAGVALRAISPVLRSLEWSPLVADLLWAREDRDFFVCGEAGLGALTGVQMCALVRRYKPELPIVLVAEDPDALGLLPEGIQVVARRGAVAAIVEQIMACEEARRRAESAPTSNFRRPTSSRSA